MQRITIKHLEAKLDYLNKLTGNDPKPYRTDEHGKLRANIGNFHLYQAYGGVNVHQMVNEGGGVRDIFHCGCITKRELAEKISAYTLGLEDAIYKRTNAGM